MCEGRRRIIHDHVNERCNTGMNKILFCEKPFYLHLFSVNIWWILLNWMARNDNINTTWRVSVCIDHHQIVIYLIKCRWNIYITALFDVCLYFWKRSVFHKSKDKLSVLWVVLLNIRYIYKVNVIVKGESRILCRFKPFCR